MFEGCITKLTTTNVKLFFIELLRSPSSNVNVFLVRLSVLIKNAQQISTSIILARVINVNVLIEDGKRRTLINSKCAMTYLVEFSNKNIN